VRGSTTVRDLFEQGDKPVNELRIERTLDAPRAAVWRAWTEPELLQEWYCPAPWRVAKVEFDLRPGGRNNVDMAGPDGEYVEGHGCWLEIVPETRLVFTDALHENFVPAERPFMTGFVELSDTADGRTHMIWGARHATEAAMREHLDMGFETGWGICAGQLETVARRVAGLAT
jgi:uncharacterized protein YndB with AHSA1/START domain